MDDARVLSSNDLLRMETASHNVEMARKNHELVQVKQKAAKTEGTLLSANYTLKLKEVEQLNIELPVAQRKIVEQADARKKLAEELKEKYGMPDSKWGYDPESGEIKID